MKSLIRVNFGLAVLLFVFALTACVPNVGNKPNKKDVTLKYLMVGPGKQVDSEKVWKTFNKKLKEHMPNLEVKFEVFTMSEYKQKFMLMQASREKIDLASTYSLNYANEVRKGTFLSIDKLIDTYGKDLQKEFPSWLWGYSKVDGKLYSIPNYQMMSVQYGFRTHKELADKYLDIERLKKSLNSSTILTNEFYDVVEEYLAKLKQNNQLYLGFYHWFTGKGYETVLGNYVVREADDKCKVYYQFNLPESKSIYARMADWYKKGYIRSDALSANNATSKIGKKDGYTVWSAVSSFGIEEQEKAKYGFDILNVDLSDHYYIPSTNAAGGTAVMAKCEDAETAVQFMNLLNSSKGKDLYNLLVYGIEGEHYQKNGEDRIQTEYAGQVTSDAKYGLYKWIIGNTKLAYQTQTDLPGYKNWVFEEVNQSKNISKLVGFVPNTEAISSKLAQVDAVKGEYVASLSSGAIPNYEEVYNQFFSKLEKAGNQDIIDELQKQIDAFLDRKGN